MPPVEVIRDEVVRPAYGHFNIIHVATALKADIYPSGDDPLHHWALPRRRAHTVAGQTVWVAPLEYVVVRKLQYARDGGSDKHLRDIRSMLRLQAGAFDEAGLLSQIAALSLEEEWANVVETRAGE